MSLVNTTYDSASSLMSSCEQNTCHRTANNASFIFVSLCDKEELTGLLNLVFSHPIKALLEASSMKFVWSI